MPEIGSRKLWHGLLTVPLAATEGLPNVELRPSVWAQKAPRVSVRRPDTTTDSHEFRCAAPASGRSKMNAP